VVTAKSLMVFSSLVAEMVIPKVIENDLWY